MNHELKEVITTKVSAIYEKIKGYREYLHQNPELSYKEFNTMEYVAAKLKEIGIPYEKGVAGTGIIGIIRSSKHSENQACIVSIKFLSLFIINFKLIKIFDKKS